MAITLYFGKTESGKSYRAQEELKARKKAIVFDRAHCFNNGEIFYDTSIKSIEKIFDKYQKKESYSLIFRPTRDVDDVVAFDRTCVLGVALGRLGGRNAKERVLFAIDEADTICSASIQSRQLKLLVNKGRHDNVDTLAIARAPQRVHTDLRINCSKLVCFSLNDALALSAINKIGVGKSELSLISSLGDKTYNYFEWHDNGEWFVKNKNGIITRKFSHAKTRNIDKGL